MGCGKPPMTEVDIERAASFYGLPPREDVERYIRKAVKDEATRNLLTGSLDYIYNSDPSHGFMAMLYRDAVRYRIPRDCWAKAVAGATVSLIGYCVTTEDGENDELCKKYVTPHVTQYIMQIKEKGKMRAVIESKLKSRQLGKVLNLLIDCARKWCKRAEVNI